MQKLKPVVASALTLFALIMLSKDIGSVADFVMRTEPTRQWMPIWNALSHVCVVLLSILLVVVKKTGTQFKPWTLGINIIYGATAIQALGLLPCLFGAGAFCGILYVLTLVYTAPIVVIAFIVIVVKSANKKIIAAGAALAVLGAIASTLLFWRVTPKTAESCKEIDNQLKRGTCFEHFALKQNDAKICDLIDFDSTRFSCLYKIAGKTGNQELCEQIKPPCRWSSPGIMCTAENYANTCWIIVARKYKQRDLCERITDSKLKSSCLRNSH